VAGLTTLLDINREIITKLRLAISDVTTRPTGEQYIYYKAPKTAPTLPFIYVNLSTFSIEPISIDDGGVVTYKSYAQSFSANGTQKNFILTNDAMSITTVEYPINTTILENAGVWYFQEPYTISFWSAPTAGTNNIKVTYTTDEEEDIIYNYSATINYAITINISANTLVEISGTKYSADRLMDYITSQLINSWIKFENSIDTTIIDFVDDPSFQSTIHNTEYNIYTKQLNFQCSAIINGGKESDIGTVYRIQQILANYEINNGEESNIIN
jgi:hypothetical protein